VNGRGSSLPRIAATSNLRALRRFLRPAATVRPVETYEISEAADRAGASAEELSRLSVQMDSKWRQTMVAERRSLERCERGLEPNPGSAA
jgi:hypothetical protein